MMEHVMNLGQIDDYIRKMTEDEKSSATIQKYAHDIRCFYQYLDETKRFGKEVVIAYKQQMKERYQLSSANSMLVALNGFLAFMGWEDCVVRLYKIQRKLFGQKEKELSKEEYERMIRTAEAKGAKRLSVLMQTIAGTGIRVSELRYITVEAVRMGRAEVSCKGKSREIMISKELRRMLLRYCKNNGIGEGCIFQTKKGTCISRGTVWAEMKRLCSEAGVMPGKVFPHNLRHLFARTYYKKRKDIVYLADILGHSSINTTRIYTITDAREHEKLISGLGLVQT